MKKNGITAWQKTLLVIFCFAIAIVGFMVKLPAAFRGMDKELHALFYFLAAACLNLLFAGTRFIRHAVIFGGLYLFGMGIEYAQGYSNRFFRRPIHGRFDPEDLQWNLKGLVAFSLLWLVGVAVLFLYRQGRSNDAGKK